jgi:endonuclease-3 related protein
MRARSGRLRAVYRRLFAAHGAQHWWPGDGPFEVMVGAVLTQNTAWSNVERAIRALREAGCLEPRRILELTHQHLAQLIRPAGYFNVKARRLKSFCAWYLEQGGRESLVRLDTSTLRRGLLSVDGVGAETADDMLLYAFERPVFVVDAYTRRLFERLGDLEGGEGYEAIRRLFESGLGPDAGLYNEYHALIVRHAKVTCRKRPLCGECPLTGLCATGGRLGAG